MLDKKRSSVIVVYMRREKLGIEHKDILFQRLKDANSPLSEYTFANLYLFRAYHEYEVLMDGEIFIRGRSYDGHTYLMPTEDLRNVDIARIRDVMGEAEFLFPLPQDWTSAFPSGEFDISYNSGDADYVYTVEKMSTYRGRHLHKKRNLLKQFLESYRNEARPLTSDRLDEARFILNDWLSVTGNQADNDYAPCLEALDRYDELVLCGGIYYADNEPAGFVLGEELNQETFVLHFAKARTKFKGVYQHIFNNFAQVLPPKYRYLNLEQDLEKENLRIFKSSYLPDLMLKKARVSLKQR